MEEETKPEMYYHRFQEKYFKMLKRNCYKHQPSEKNHTIGYPKRDIKEAMKTHMTWFISDIELTSMCERVPDEKCPTMPRMPQ